ncbi:MAG: DUF2461 domain-containing protein [Gemmatimonadota bacterium]|nr:MAG: DUF2461 domain-containing protein [Gemmatimonadota bacterium]
MVSATHFTKATFGFLEELAANNNRPWFEKNRSRYEEHVREPAMRFITDFRPRLKKISLHFKADPRPVGGSMFRIYRDTRFSKDKSPYKTYTGIQFRHDLGKDAHAPGFYLHLEPKNVFVGLGCWHPDGPSVKKIREAIVDDPAGWKRATRGRRFTSRFELAGDSLVRHPRGFDPDHPLIDDLKRKDFIGVAPVTRKEVTAHGFLEGFAEACADGKGLVRFLCKAVGAPF